MHTLHELSCNYPPLLTHPGRHLLTHTCTGSHTYRDRCHTLERWAAIHSAQGAWGYGALLKGTSDVTRRWTATPPAVSPPILWAVRVGIVPPTFRVLDDPLSPLSHGRPFRQNLMKPVPADPNMFVWWLNWSDTLSQIFPEIKVIPEEELSPFPPVDVHHSCCFFLLEQLLLLLNYSH